MPDNGQVYPGLVIVTIGLDRGLVGLIGRWTASVLGFGSFGHLSTLRRSASLGITPDGWYRMVGDARRPARRYSRAGSP
jgi:hypothetical protein